MTREPLQGLPLPLLAGRDTPPLSQDYKAVAFLLEKS